MSPTTTPLDNAIKTYTRRGYRVVSRTETSAQMAWDITGGKVASLILRTVVFLPLALVSVGTMVRMKGRTAEIGVLETGEVTVAEFRRNGTRIGESGSAAPAVSPTHVVVPTTSGAAITLSADRTHWWDGSSWQTVATSTPSGADMSPSGHHWFDGVAWQPIAEPAPIAATVA